MADTGPESTATQSSSSTSSIVTGTGLDLDVWGLGGSVKLGNRDKAILKTTLCSVGDAQGDPNCTGINVSMF